jgi:hypothetical protein
MIMKKMYRKILGTRQGMWPKQLTMIKPGFRL